MDHVEGQYKVRDISLADEGRRRIDWAESRMPVMMALREKYSETKPLAGYRIAGCLHVTKETAVLIRTLKAAGARVSWSGCNPLSTNDSVAAALAEEGIEIFAWYGLNTEDFYWCIEQTLEPSSAIARRRCTPVVVSSVPPIMVSVMCGNLL